MTLDLSKLNKEQKEAVLWDKGPLLIVAGAGTGKTTVITQRIVNLIEKKLALPEEILAVTFTEKAAFEMEERVDKLLDFGYIDLWISTFHSFCERVLRENALDIGLPNDFKILDATAGWLLARQNLDKFDLKYYKALGNPTKFIQALISHFSHCKDQDVSPENYLEYAESLKTRDDGPEDGETERIMEVANAYHVYQRILLENSCLDFGDLINYCLKLFQKRPLILKKYREKFKYILVDEFQDTNWSQYELIKLLAAPINNLCVCADDDQAIYRWRGASFSNIVKFQEDFPKAKQVSLIKNYRSAQNILDRSYNFIIQNNPDRLEFRNKINKKLIADTEEKGIIEHIHERTLDQEVGGILKKILEILKRDKDATYNDFAILVRANDSAIPFIRALERANLPYQFLASRGLYSKPIILDIISYFKLLDNYHEGTAVYRILNLPFLEILDADIAAITQFCRKKTISLFDALNELALIPGISAKTQEKVALVLSLIKKHSADAREKGVSEILVAFLEDSGYLKYLIHNEETEKIDLLNQFYKKIKTFEEATVEPTLKNFMEEINLELESGEEGKLEFDPEQGPDMIKVMTIHGAKGLEFKYVFLVNMVDRRFPTDQRKDPIELPDELIKDIKPKGDVHLQEERRLCYVAMTRAKKELYFTSADDYGGQRKKKISRFLSEMNYKAESENLPKEKKGLMAEKLKPAERLKKKIEPQYLPQHFSYSQLAAFEKCPLQYKFGFILKVPTRGKAVFSFGKTMHNTLYEFLKLVNEDKKTAQENLFGEKNAKKTKKKNTDFDELTKLYEKNWIGEWYENQKQKDDYYKLGKKIIKEFYAQFEKNPPKILKINGQLALEMPFNLKIGEHTLFGVIDRIDDTKNGIEIIDYKTGSSKEKPDKEQLLIYQIATEEVLHLKPKQLAYYYLEDGKFASFLGSEKDIATQKEKIIQEIEKIKNSEFEPTPGWQCQYCDFKDICDFAQR
ncbi:MAG: UvrD-helicase domain-containing protein [Candidatus Staskawiczbacteria bacterium]|jgi:DNA helicase-2/ATP-dependent DNA helicase PcrA